MSKQTGKSTSGCTESEKKYQNRAHIHKSGSRLATQTGVVAHTVPETKPLRYNFFTTILAFYTLTETSKKVE